MRKILPSKLETVALKARQSCEPEHGEEVCLGVMRLNLADLASVLINPPTQSSTRRLCVCDALYLANMLPLFLFIGRKNLLVELQSLTTAGILL